MEESFFAEGGLCGKRFAVIEISNECVKIAMGKLPFHNKIQQALHEGRDFSILAISTIDHAILKEVRVEIFEIETLLLFPILSLNKAT